MRALLIAFVVLSLTGCSSESEGSAPPRTCTTIDLTCTPAYEPTFENVFTKTLKPTCGKAGVSCHSSSGRQGGLAFEEPDIAFADLQNGKVLAGDPACSSIVVRVTATDPMVRMPPGKQLDPGEQCAIAKWIEGGAQR